jgi:hypothetical protein
MSFRDNGDGTVTDDGTGLMWEKKVQPPNSFAADVHSVNYGYSWSQPGDPSEVTGTAPDGTAFTLFLRNLNTQENGGFAGHNDWRLPTRQELLSIVDRSQFPAIDPIFGPTKVGELGAWGYYWSGDTDARNPHYAWAVNFGSVNPDRNRPEVANASKVNESWVRAVRTVTR